MTFAGIIAAFKGAAWVSKFAGVATLIPGAGPIALAVKAAADFLMLAIKGFFNGLTIAFANPTVFLIVAAAFAGGLWQGIKWDAHKVEVARSDTESIKRANRDADADSRRRLDAANKARIAAEETAKAAEDRADRARADAKRLRNTAVAKPVVSGDAAKGSWLSGIPALSKFGGAPAAGR